MWDVQNGPLEGAVKWCSGTANSGEVQWMATVVSWGRQRQSSLAAPAPHMSPPLLNRARSNGGKDNHGTPKGQATCAGSSMASSNGRKEGIPHRQQRRRNGRVTDVQTCIDSGLDGLQGHGRRLSRHPV